MNVEIELIKVATNVGTLGLTFYLVFVMARFVDKNAPYAWKILEMALGKECQECAKRAKEEKEKKQ